MEDRRGRRHERNRGVFYLQQTEYENTIEGHWCRGFRTDIEELAVNADFGDQGGEAVLEVANLFDGGVVLGEGGRHGLAVEKMLDAHEARLEQVERGEGGLVHGGRSRWIGGNAVGGNAIGGSEVAGKLTRNGGIDRQTERLTDRMTKRSRLRERRAASAGAGGQEVCQYHEQESETCGAMAYCRR